MRLHWKKGSKMHKDSHHHLKRKHFKRTVLRSMFDDGDIPCKKKHFKRMMKGRSMMAPGHHGWKHFKGQDYSSSDSDDSDHHGKRKHFKRMMKRRSMGPGHHGWKHFKGRGHSSSDSDDDDHHGRGKHFKGMKGPRSHDDHHGKGYVRCMPGTGESHHHGKGNPLQGRSMSCSDDEAMLRRCMSDNERGHRGRMGMRERFMADIEAGHHGRGQHFKGMQGHLDGEVTRRQCMSDNEGRHPHGRMRFMGMRGRPMTDIEEGHHVRGRHMSASDDEHHGKGRHMRSMMHHHKGKHWKKGHGRRGFFEEDGALVPICATGVENRPEATENENTADQAAEAVAEDEGRTRDQGTQTSGIMEIVIEDQEAQNAAIRIVNKFL